MSSPFNWLKSDASDTPSQPQNPTLPASWRSSTIDTIERAVAPLAQLRVTLLKKFAEVECPLEEATALLAIAPPSDRIPAVEHALLTAWAKGILDTWGKTHVELVAKAKAEAKRQADIARKEAELAAEQKRREDLATQGAWQAEELARADAEKRKWTAYEREEAAYRDWKATQPT